jgi:hypothetical protein
MLQSHQLAAKKRTITALRRTARHGRCLTTAAVLKLWWARPQALACIYGWQVRGSFPWAAVCWPASAAAKQAHSSHNLLQGATWV